jgi:hypothetical protein
VATASQRASQCPLSGHFSTGPWLLSVSGNFRTLGSGRSRGAHELPRRKRPARSQPARYPTWTPLIQHKTSGQRPWRGYRRQLVRLARQVIGRRRHQGTPPEFHDGGTAPELPPHPAQQQLPTPALTRPEPVTQRLPAHRPAPHHPGPGPRPTAGCPDTADRKLIETGTDQFTGPNAYPRRSRTRLRYVPAKFRTTVSNGHSWVLCLMV